MGPTALRGIRATGDTLSNVESQVFTPYKFGSSAGDRTPDLLTTRPTCYHSAMALCGNYSPSDNQSCDEIVDKCISNDELSIHTTIHTTTPYHDSNVGQVSQTNMQLKNVPENFTAGTIKNYIEE